MIAVSSKATLVHQYTVQSIVTALSNARTSPYNNYIMEVLKPLIVALFAVLVYDTSASTWRRLVPEQADHPHQCYDSVTNSYQPLNSTWRRPEACEGFKCSTSDEEGFLLITGFLCPYATKLPANCHMTPEKPVVAYPECCPELKCDGEPQDSISMVG